MELSFEDIADLLNYIAALDCGSVEVSVGDVRVAVRKKGAPTPPEGVGVPGDLGKAGPAAPATTAVPTDELAGSSAPAPAAESEPSAAYVAAYEKRVAAGEAVLVRSPMVGTFYRAKEPGAPPFVEVGDEVGAGDALCLVEVMKLFHSISAECAGTVEAIFADDAAIVEFGQPLMLIAVA